MSEETLHPVNGVGHLYYLHMFYEDTDTSGAFCYANYLKVVERVRTELLRVFGILQKLLAEASGTIFAMRWVEADFLGPAHLDDELELRTKAVECRGAHFAMGQVIGREEDLVRMVIEIACVNAKGRATRIPSPVVCRRGPGV